MDSIGDYIYFIVLCIVPLISALSKKKDKKNDATEPLSNEEEEQDTIPTQSWEDLMQQLKQKKEKQKERIKETIFESVKENKKQDKNVYSKTKENKEIIIENKKPIEEKNEWAFDTVNDAKRAFVYSEIFNRKY